MAGKENILPGSQVGYYHFLLVVVKRITLTRKLVRSKLSSVLFFNLSILTGGSINHFSLHFGVAATAGVLHGECSIIIIRSFPISEENIATMEQTPTRIVCNIHVKLLNSFVIFHYRSMNSNDITDFANHWKVFHSLREKSHQSKLYVSFSALYI